MKRLRTSDLVERIVAGEEPGAELIDRFRTEHVDEDLHLDYKHGAELTKGNAAAEVRKYVAGFANSAGGLLVIGLDEMTWTVTGCSAPGGGALTDWASRALTDLAPYLAPPPRIHTVEHRNGNLLVIAVARSPLLTPCAEKGALAYFLRLGDQTLEVPPYLMSDLVLGRRQHPSIEIASAGIHCTHTKPTGGVQPIQMDLSLHVVNDGPMWASDLSGGIIAPVLGKTPQRISPQLLSYIDSPAPVDCPHELALRHFSSQQPRQSTEAPSLGPFGELQLAMRTNGSAFIADRDYVVRAAAYVVARGSPAVWHQITMRFDSASKIVRVERVERAFTSRVEVSWGWSGEQA